MPKTNLYFVRHGETEYNRKRIVQGRRIDSTLNETGRAQAEALAERFAAVPLDVIYTSTLRRAVQTAQPFMDLHPDVPVRRLTDLEEMSWGIYEGEPASPYIQGEFERLATQWRNGAFDERIEEGESILDVQRRALRALEEILTRHAGCNVLVITHGRFLRVLLATLLEEYGLHRMHEIQHANTAVNHLVCERDRFEAMRLNCTDHLAEVETIMVE